MEYFTYLQEQNQELKDELLSLLERKNSAKGKYIKQKVFLEDILNQDDTSNSHTKDKILNRSFDKNFFRRKSGFPHELILEIQNVKKNKKILSMRDSISD